MNTRIGTLRSWDREDEGDSVPSIVEPEVAQLLVTQAGEFLLTQDGDRLAYH